MPLERETEPHQLGLPAPDRTLLPNPCTDLRPILASAVGEEELSVKWGSKAHRGQGWGLGMGKESRDFTHGGEGWGGTLVL